MKRLANIHPGEVLKLEFMDPLDISGYRLAGDIGVPPIRISEIVHGKRAITPDTAFRLARYLDTTPEFWINLQTAYDLEEVRLGRDGEYDKIKPRELAVA